MTRLAQRSDGTPIVEHSGDLPRIFAAGGHTSTSSRGACHQIEFPDGVAAGFIGREGAVRGRGPR